MPLYGYRCPVCGQVYEVVRPDGRRSDVLPCILDGARCEPTLAVSTRSAGPPVLRAADWLDNHTHGEGTASWPDLLAELRQQVGVWTRELRASGVRGGDVLFACIAPAIDMYATYARVLDLDGRPVPIEGDRVALEPHARGYLAYVWETLDRLALDGVFGAGINTLEADARLAALMLSWAFTPRDASPSAIALDDDEAARQRLADAGLALEVVRSFSEPLGIRLDDWEGTLIETDAVEVVRLRSMAERAPQLLDATPADASTLDRVHASMILARQGRDDALRALLRDERSRADGGAAFLDLAAGLAILYPEGWEEHRLLMAVRHAIPD